MKNLNQIMAEAPIRMGVRPSIRCKDGFTMSVQASGNHYSKWNNGAWETVEVAYPSEAETLLMGYIEPGSEDPLSAVYGYVPVEVIESVLIKHGGFAGYVEDDRFTDDYNRHRQIPLLIRNMDDISTIFSFKDGCVLDPEVGLGISIRPKK